MHSLKDYNITQPELIQLMRFMAGEGEIQLVPGYGRLDYFTLTDSSKESLAHTPEEG